MRDQQTQLASREAGGSLPKLVETREAKFAPLRLAIVHNFPVRKQGYSLPQPWETAISGWLSWLRAGGTPPTTERTRRGHVRTIAKRSRTRHPSQLTSTAIITLFSESDWSADHRKGVRTSLISFYSWAIDHGVCTRNPALVLPKVAGSKPKPRPAPNDIWHELLEQAAPRERLMAMLAGEAGLRRAEVAVVARDDLIEDGSGWALIVHGKGGKQRVVPITDRLAREIRAHRPRGYLFPGQIDGHISAHHVGKLISGLMPPGWSMHQLRHRFATRGYAGTGNLRAVQLALGHSSVATTERYTAVSPRDVRSVAEAAADDGPGAA